MQAKAEGNGFKPEVVILYCQQSVGGDVRLPSSYRELDTFKVRFVVLPCSSNVEIRPLVKLFEEGADGIQLIGCKGGACRFLVGSDKAEKRIDYVRRLLEEIDFGPERVAMERGAGFSEASLLDLGRQMAERVQPLGPNPMRRKGQ